ncbi:MAG: hypothetical protein Q8S57_11915 [Methanoregula sp.]|nr:hypothetical protein [Methanoregula sp.]
MFGIAFLNFSPDNIQLSCAILSLALLSIGLFFTKTMVKISPIRKYPKIEKYIIWIFLIPSAVIMIALEKLSLATNGKLSTAPLYMASLAIGFFLASSILMPETENQNPK